MVALLFPNFAGNVDKKHIIYQFDKISIISMRVKYIYKPETDNDNHDL